MTCVAYALFDTAIGVCALGWRGQAIVGAWLPEADTATLRRRVLRRWPQAQEAVPPGFVAEAQAAVCDLMASGTRDLANIAVDLGGLDAFDRQVLEATRRIPPGRTRTYGQIAAEIGQPRAAQAVGAALGRNPVPIIVPCHRVLAAGGRAGGFSAPGGVSTKLKLLALENARVGDEPTLL